MYDIVICDKSSPSSADNIAKIKESYPYARTVRYWGDYLSTINRVAESVKTSHFWFVSSECNLSDWNFNWHPDAWERDQIHCWSNNQNKFGSVFLIPKHEWAKQQPSQLELFKNINYHTATFKSESHDKFLSDVTADNLASGVQHIRHLGDFHTLISRCCENSKTELFYLFLNHRQPLDWHYRDLPDPGWNQSTVYHFHTPNQKYGEIFLVNKRKYLASGISEFADLDDVMYVPVKTLTPVKYSAVILQHTNSSLHPCEQYFDTTYTRFFGNYLNSFRRLPKTANKLWVFTDLSDYESFDWQYQTAPWETKIDVWPAGNQNCGDTFLLSTEFLRAVDTLEAIHEWPMVDYDHISVLRRPWPEVNYWGDNLADIVKATEFTSDFVLFKHSDVDVAEIYEPSYWAEPNIYDQGARGAHALIPKQAKAAIERQIYDYDIISRTPNSRLIEFPQDVVFISYDETNADHNYEQLLKQTSAKRVHGVRGQTQALKAAANQSSTPWFWAVFGKTQVVDNFNWSWTPDFFKNPCNYVFHGYNPVLDYSYGHGGVILYNTNWVKTVESWGFDFTMSYELETVPIISTTVDYANTPTTAWRTAIREGYKLAYHLSKRPSIEDEYVLDLWLTKENTEHGAWSRLGAHMGREMFWQGQAYDLLMDWDWLREAFDRLLAVVKKPQDGIAYPIDLLVREITMHGKT